jgi:hypothetical protein
LVVQVQARLLSKFSFQVLDSVHLWCSTIIDKV